MALRFRTGAAGNFVSGWAPVAAYSAPVELETYVPPIVDEDCRRVGALSVGIFGQKIFDDDLQRDCTSRFDTPDTEFQFGFAASAGFFTMGGQRLGGLRIDAQRPIVEQFIFEKDSQNCRAGKMTLRELPDFPLLDRMVVRVNWIGGNDEFYQYTGYTEFFDKTGNTKNKYILQLFGLVEQIRTLRKEDTYIPSGPGDDVGIVVDYLAQTYVGPETNALYVPSNIDTTTGETVTTTIEIGKYNLSKVFDTLAKLASKPELDVSYRWGVNGRGEFFFLPENQNIIKVFKVGYDGVDTYDPKKVTDQPFFVNQTSIRRKKISGSDNAGWEVAAVVSDATSIANNGLSDYPVTVPGYFTNDLCTRIGQTIVEQGKDPKFGAELKKVPVYTSSDFLDMNRRVRVISPPAVFDEVISELDDSSAFTKTGAGDSILSDDTTFKISGASALKLDYTNATGDIYETNVSAQGFIQNVIVHVRSNKAGAILRVGAGRFNWNDFTLDLPITITGQSIPYKIAYSLTKLGKFGFEIIDPDTLTPTTIYIDRLEIEKNGHRHIDYSVTRARYTLGPTDNFVDLSLGPEPIAAVDHTAGLIDLVDNLEATSENK